MGAGSNHLQKYTATKSFSARIFPNIFLLTSSIWSPMEYTSCEVNQSRTLFPLVRSPRKEEIFKSEINRQKSNKIYVVTVATIPPS